MYDDTEGQFLSRSKTESVFGKCMQKWCSAEESDFGAWATSYLRNHWIMTVQLAMLHEPKKQIKSKLPCFEAASSVLVTISFCIQSEHNITTCHQSKTFTGTPTSGSKEAWNYNLNALQCSGGRVMELFCEGMIWLLLFILSSDWSEEAGVISHSSEFLEHQKWILSKVWYPQVRLPVWISTAQVSISLYWRSCFWYAD